MADNADAPGIHLRERTKERVRIGRDVGHPRELLDRLRFRLRTSDGKRDESALREFVTKGHGRLAKVLDACGVIDSVPRDEHRRERPGTIRDQKPAVLELSRRGLHSHLVTGEILDVRVLNRFDTGFLDERGPLAHDAVPVFEYLRAAARPVSGRLHIRPVVELHDGAVGTELARECIGRGHERKDVVPCQGGHFSFGLLRHRGEERSGGNDERHQCENGARGRVHWLELQDDLWRRDPRVSGERSGNSSNPQTSNQHLLPRRFLPVLFPSATAAEPTCHFQNSRARASARASSVENSFSFPRALLSMLAWQTSRARDGNSNERKPSGTLSPEPDTAH